MGIEQARWSGPIVLRDETEIEKTGGQARFHQQHTRGIAVATQQQQRPVGGVSGSDDEMRARQAIAATSGFPATPPQGAGLEFEGVDAAGLETLNGQSQSATLPHVPGLAIGEDEQIEGLWLRGKGFHVTSVGLELDGGAVLPRRWKKWRSQVLGSVRAVGGRGNAMRQSECSD